MYIQRTLIPAKIADFLFSIERKKSHPGAVPRKGFDPEQDLSGPAPVGSMFKI
jgi:hypothetical protein